MTRIPLSDYDTADGMPAEEPATMIDLDELGGRGVVLKLKNGEMYVAINNNIIKTSTFSTSESTTITTGDTTQWGNEVDYLVTTQ